MRTLMEALSSTALASEMLDLDHGSPVHEIVGHHAAHNLLVEHVSVRRLALVAANQQHAGAERRLRLNDFTPERFLAKLHAQLEVMNFLKWNLKLYMIKLNRFSILTF
jgi:hypothetical protein